MSDGQERTQRPSARRIEQARSEGRFTRSQQLNSALVISSILVLVLLLGPPLLSSIQDQLKGSLSHASVDAAQTSDKLYLEIQQTFTTFAPALLGILLASALIGGIQSRFQFFPSKLSLDFSRLWQPSAALPKSKKWTQAVVGIGQWLAAISIGGTGIYLCFGDLAIYSTLPLNEFSLKFGKALLLIVSGMIVALLLTGGLDYIYQWWLLQNDLSLTDQEHRDEMQAVEGNRAVRARQRSRRNELRNNAAAEIAPSPLSTAQLIVVGYESAIAIDNREEPLIVEKASADQAGKIVDYARSHGLLIVNNDHLASSLMRKSDELSILTPAEEKQLENSVDSIT